MTDRTKAERALAFLIHEIRDEWDEHGTLSVIRKLSDKPLGDVAAAALYCAVKRTEQRTPACIGLSGEHWQAFNRGADVVPALPYYDRAPVVSEPHPITDPAAIRAIRAAAKAAATEGEQ